MGKRKIVIISLLFAIIVLGISIYFFTNNISDEQNSTNDIKNQTDVKLSSKNVEIKEKTYTKLADNLYCVEDVDINIDSNYYDKMKKYYASVADYMKANFPSLTFCIYSVSYYTQDSYHREQLSFEMEQFMNNAIIDDTWFSVVIFLDDDNIQEHEYLDYDSYKFIRTSLDSTINISMDEAIHIATKYIEENLDKIFTSGLTREKISGDCCLRYYSRYNSKHKLCYVIELNQYGEIVIDAVTGEFVSQFLSNGIIF